MGGDYEGALEYLGRAEERARENALHPRQEFTTWTEYQATCIKTIAIGKANFEANCSEACAICLDTHINGESVVTKCKHSFGKRCWQEWMVNPHGNQRCPTCREPCPKITDFIMRRPRSNAILEEEEKK
jgi:hypothetical protein